MSKEQELKAAIKSLLEYIDKIPKEMAEKFPTMPGIDRDYVNHLISVKYGCFCDLEDGMDPADYPCVIDTGREQDCVYARRLQCKEQCEYWKEY